MAGAAAGDGKLGLLVAQLLACQRPGQVTLFGRHASKMSLVQGLAAQLVVSDELVARHSGKFDLVVEASGGWLRPAPALPLLAEVPCWAGACAREPLGACLPACLPAWAVPVAGVDPAHLALRALAGSSSSIKASLALTRPMGTLVLKSTVSLRESQGLGWSELANQIVVEEKHLLGSRCGPMDMALRMLEQHGELRQLVNAMTQHVLPLSRGEEAMQLAQTKGVLKVQLECQG
jgi:threonine dehydrogenase-like Zn-dependent dehydrogenase